MTNGRWTTAALLAAGLAMAGCGGGDGDGAEDRGADPADGRATDARGVSYTGDADRPMSREEIERGRMDGAWTEVVEVDTTGSGHPINSPETWEELSAETVNNRAAVLPLAGDVAGPSVLRVQILLDRAFFSPGIMDGRWGKNTAKAVYFFQRREGLPGTARVDSATYARLLERAGQGQPVRAHRLTAEDVKGPFVTIPEDIYAHAELDCSCYESLSEKLSEMFHATPELLAKLNPGVDLDAARAGQTIQVPAVRDPNAAPVGQIAQILVSGRGSYVHAVDANGRILYHFPSTLGSTYDPSPTGEFTITHIARDPAWHYQPDILAHVPDGEPDAMIPAGPNVAVGAVWMDLSAPHYGIHGTSAPETIGYATSAGCVRLTNWDALFLAGRVREGTPVRFRDTGGGAG